MHDFRATSLAFSGIVFAAAASCSTSGNKTTSSPEPLTRSREATGGKVELPASCVIFLAQLQCRLRVTGNEAPAIDLALGALRASLEAPSVAGVVGDLEARCKNDMRVRQPAIAAAGCGDAVGRLGDLPPSHPANCAPQEFFFVRSDGRVAGCRRDCTNSRDCPTGTSCTAIGYAPGGPLDEPFCE
jgi:hypothetical protein